MDSQPPEVWPVTVRLPVTAMAFVGTLIAALPGFRFVTWKVRAIPVVSGPLKPLSRRESSSRLGVSAAKLAPFTTIDADAAEAGPVPAALVPLTVNVYETPLVRSLTTHESTAVVQVLPPGLLVTVNLVTGLP